MRSNRNTGLGAFVLFVVLAFGPLIAWVGNFYKLTQCDFEPDYKCEILHGVGIIPVISLGTVWFGTDEGDG